MTIRQLRIFQKIALPLILFFGFILSFSLYFMVIINHIANSTATTIFWIVVAAIYLCFIILGIYLQVTIYKKLNAVYNQTLNPDLLKEEIRNAFMLAFPFRNVKYMRSTMEILHLSLLGDYQGALAVCFKTQALNDASQDAKKLNLFYFYLRTGSLDSAREMVDDISKLCNNSKKPYQKISSRYFGLYYLEIGDLSSARRLLIANLEKSTTNIAKLSSNFDLARLEEKEGNLDKAMEHYRQAAEIGPKTWMGQEAARRLSQRCEMKDTEGIHPDTELEK